MIPASDPPHCDAPPVPAAPWYFRPLCLDHDPPVDLCRSRVLGRKTFIAWRAFTLVYFVAWTVYEPLSYPVGVFFFIYLTHWSALLECVYFIAAFVSAVWGPSLVRSVAFRPARRWFRFQRVVHVMASVISLEVTLLYWILLYLSSPSSPNPATVNMHASNSFLMLVDCLLIATAIDDLFHVVWPLLFASIYVAFSALYWRGGGRNESGFQYIYLPLDYGNPLTAGITATSGVVIGVPILYLFYFFWSRLGIYLGRRLASVRGVVAWEANPGVGAWPGAGGVSPSLSVGNESSPPSDDILLPEGSPLGIPPGTAAAYPVGVVLAGNRN